VIFQAASQADALKVDFSHLVTRDTQTIKSIEQLIGVLYKEYNTLGPEPKKLQGRVIEAIRILMLLQVGIAANKNSGETDYQELETYLDHIFGFKQAKILNLNNALNVFSGILKGTLEKRIKRLKQNLQPNRENSEDHKNVYTTALAYVNKAADTENRATNGAPIELTSQIPSRAAIVAMLAKRLHASPKETRPAQDLNDIWMSWEVWANTWTRQ
jgi:hypothetical protein